MANGLDELNWVIAGRHHHLDGGAGALGVWNLYPTQEEASRVLAADERGRITSAYFPGTAAVMDFNTFVATQKADMLSASKLEEISESTYSRVLNELPPLKWETVDGVERFLHCEYITVPYTYQYAVHGGRYFSCLVDATDPQTWITASKINDLLAAKDNEQSSAARK